MEGIIRHNASDLVLKVRDSYDPSKLNLNEWEDYLDILCGNREYQKRRNQKQAAKRPEQKLAHDA